MRTSRLRSFCYAMIFMAIAVGCHGNDGRNSCGYPSGFGQRSDFEKVAYMVEHVSADSVARFICDGVSGRNTEIGISSFNDAVRFVHGVLRGEKRASFSREIDCYSSSMPLNYRMKIYSQAAEDDPMRFGYELCKSYSAEMLCGKTTKEIENEIEAFRQACASDTVKFRKFIMGLRVASVGDSLNGVPVPEI